MDRGTHRGLSNDTPWLRIWGPHDAAWQACWGVTYVVVNEKGGACTPAALGRTRFALVLLDQSLLPHRCHARHALDVARVFLFTRGWLRRRHSLNTPTAAHPVLTLAFDTRGIPSF